MCSALPVCSFAFCHFNLEIFGQDPWKKFRARLALGLIFLGWIFFAMIVYQISLFDYEMANFDPYEILEVNFL